jgi:hypothetical protein
MLELLDDVLRTVQYSTLVHTVQPEYTTVLPQIADQGNSTLGVTLCVLTDNFLISSFSYSAPSLLFVITWHPELCLRLTSIHQGARVSCV